MEKNSSHKPIFTHIILTLQPAHFRIICYWYIFAFCHIDLFSLRRSFSINLKKAAECSVYVALKVFYDFSYDFSI